MGFSLRRLNATRAASSNASDIMITTIFLPRIFTVVLSTVMNDDGAGYGASSTLKHKSENAHRSLLLCEYHSVNEYRSFKYKVQCTVGYSLAGLITTSNTLLSSGSK